MATPAAVSVRAGGIPMKILRSYRRTAALILVLVSAGIAQSADDPLETVQKSSEAWLQTRLETARLDSSWATERALLESTLGAYRERATTAEEKRDLAQAKTAQEREELEGLKARAKAAQVDLQRADERIKALEAKLVRLRARLPPHLSAGLDFAYRSLADPAVTPAERMQLTATILSRCVQFDRAITLGEDVVTLEAGQPPRAVDVIYWGLSHAYALDRHAGRTWLGRPGQNGWAWEALPDATRHVAKLIAIYQGRADPEFVLAPARLPVATPSAKEPAR